MVETFSQPRLVNSGNERRRSEAEIALVVCTRNRGEKLRPFFESVRRLRSSVPWELVIVDNGSTDDTSALLHQFSLDFSGKLIVVNEHQPGLGRARNRGWKQTDAPIIAFTDDDCYPEPDYLAAIHRAFQDGELGFVGGQVRLHDPLDALVTVKESLIDERVEPGSFIAAGWVHGANFAFRREALEEIQGFDDNLGAGTRFPCEDVDAMTRALAAGWSGKYDYRPVVAHHHGRKPESPDLEKLLLSYEWARGSYYMKCILFFPQRWQCLSYWWRQAKRQSRKQALRELRAAWLYLVHVVRQPPNRSCGAR